MMEENHFTQILMTKIIVVLKDNLFIIKIIIVMEMIYKVWLIVIDKQLLVKIKNINKI